MDEEIVKKYRQAGKIANEALHYGKTLLKTGVKVRDILDKVEEKVKSLGGELAFPSQISLNEVAAHACSDLEDETILEDQVVKLDVGAHVDGYVGDNALTVDLSGKYVELLKANKEALDNVLKIVAPGTTLSEIGRTVEETIASYGFKPVRNLSGHGLGQYQIHTKPSIPNFDTKSTLQLKAGMVIAIEPFASTGAGLIKERGIPTVFEQIREVGTRDPITRNVMKEISTYKNLPFAKRWLERKFGKKVNFALRKLVQQGAIRQHPPLCDIENGIVSQFEHSVIIQEKPIIFTKRL